MVKTLIVLGKIDTELFWNAPEIVRVVYLALLVIGSLLVLYVFGYIIKEIVKRHSTPHFAQLTNKFIVYGGYIAILITILLELGVDLRGLLATAGIAGVAIGFAAQTSLSNFISGLFLIGEKPFQIGDLIRVEGILGFVESIDLLSIKVRTMDNLFIRIPNESMIKSPVTTVTRYPIRRMDVIIGVAYREDIGKVMEILKELATNNSFVLDEPEPLIIFENFADSALQFKYGLWFEKRNYLKLRNSIMREIKERFDRDGIEIPFPHLSLYAGSETRPFPVKVVSSDLDAAFSPQTKDQQK